MGVLSSIAVLLHYKKITAFDFEAIQNQALIFFAGFIFIILGSLIIVAHPFWTSDWRLIITIMGWMIFLKGVGRLFFPEAIRRLIASKRENRWFVLGEVAVLLLGLYFLYVGFVVF